MLTKKMKRILKAGDAFTCSQSGVELSTLIQQKTEQVFNIYFPIYHRCTVHNLNSDFILGIKEKDRIDWSKRSIKYNAGHAGSWAASIYSGSY